MSGYPQGPLPPYENNGTWAVILCTVIRALAILVVSLRIYTRTQAKNTAGWDDLCIVLSACLTVFGCVNDWIRDAHDWGRHIEYLSHADIVTVNKWMMIGELSNFISVFFVRLSICVFTLRLLPNTQVWPRRFTFFAIALNFVSTLANCIIFATRCHPVEAIWDQDLQKPGMCLSWEELAIAFGVVSACGVVVDFVVIVVPIFVIRNLQMNKRTKIGISIIMSLSFLTAMCSVGKMVTTIHIQDPIFDTVPVYLFSIFEECCGIICASMPAMRQLYKHIKSTRGHQRIPEHPGNNPYSVGSAATNATERRDKSMDVDIELNEIHKLEKD